MILYTPLSQADIFPDNGEGHTKKKFVSHQGRLLYVEEMDEGSYQLLQLLSTDPQDYLNTTYSPGNYFM